MNQRPQHFRLNYGANLGNGLVFAGLGQHTGSTYFHDSSAHENYGTLTNMDPPTDWLWEPELGRWALDFDGSTQSIVCPLSTSVQTQDFTVSCWVKSSSWVNQGIYTVGTFLTDGHAVYSTSGGIVRAYLRGTPIDLFAAPGPTVSTWYHFAVRKVGTAVTSWWNGVAGLGGAAAGALVYTGTCEVGRASSNYDLCVGQIADFMLHNRGLSPAEIAREADPAWSVMKGGLILPPRRRVFKATAAPPAGVAPTSVLSGSLVGPFGGPI